LFAVTEFSGDGAIGLYSAAGDACAGRRLGFGRRRAALAARFARHRAADDATVAASWLAGALADIGLIAITLDPNTSEHTRTLVLADAPLHGARIVAALPGAPTRAADMVRWHREHDDGTGYPDHLRWDGIPTAAAALGIAHAFVAAVDDPTEPRAPEEALFTLMAESGRKFRVELVRAFRDFMSTNAQNWDTPIDAAPDPASADDVLLSALATRIDARDSRTAGRTDRLAAIAASTAERLSLDPARAARLARLFALSRATADVTHDDFDPLSRFARERRTADANHAAAIAASVRHYAADAPLLAATAAWHEEGQPHPLAAVLALALAVDALPAVDARSRIAAAAGTQFDPAVTRAYLAAIGAAT
jgi:HD domain